MSATNQPKIYSDEEIELFIEGDRRAIDRLLLQGINNLAVVLILHSEAEASVFDGMGTAEQVKSRAIWIDAQIKKQEKVNSMMQKVAESSAAWAMIAFLGFLAMVSWEYVAGAIKAKIGHL